MFLPISLKLKSSFSFGCAVQEVGIFWWLYIVVEKIVFVGSEGMLPWIAANVLGYSHIGGSK